MKKYLIVISLFALMIVGCTSHFDKGYIFFNQAMYQEAEMEWSKIKKPESLRLEKVKEAQTAREIINLHKSGMQNYDTGNYDSAEQDFLKALSADVYGWIHRPDTLGQCLTECKTNLANIYNARGEKLEREHNYRKSIEHYQKAIWYDETDKSKNNLDRVHKKLTEINDYIISGNAIYGMFESNPLSTVQEKQEGIRLLKQAISDWESAITEDPSFEPELKSKIGKARSTIPRLENEIANELAMEKKCRELLESAESSYNAGRYVEAINTWKSALSCGAKSDIINAKIKQAEEAERLRLEDLNKPKKTGKYLTPNNISLKQRAVGTTTVDLNGTFWWKVNVVTAGDLEIKVPNGFLVSVYNMYEGTEDKVFKKKSSGDVYYARLPSGGLYWIKLENRSSSKDCSIEAFLYEQFHF